MGTTVTTVRQMTADDLRDVVDLEERHQPTPWSMQVFATELDTPGRRYLVVEEEGVVGFGGVMVIGDEAHITNLLIDPQWRRLGLGRRLCVDLVDWAVSHGARHLTLEVRSRNREARSLYARLGMAPVGVRPRYYGDDDAVIMWAHDIDDQSFLEGLR